MSFKPLQVFVNCLYYHVDLPREGDRNRMMIEYITQLLIVQHDQTVETKTIKICYWQFAINFSKSVFPWLICYFVAQYIHYYVEK